MGIAKLTNVGAPMPTDLIERLDRIAKANERKRAAEIRIAVREYVERREADEKAAA